MIGYEFANQVERKILLENVGFTFFTMTLAKAVRKFIEYVRASTKNKIELNIQIFKENSIPMFLWHDNSHAIVKKMQNI